MAIAVSFVRKVTGSGVTSVTTAAAACNTGDTLNAWSTADQAVAINKPTDTAGNDYGTPVAAVNTGGSSSKQAAYVRENAAGHASNQLTFTYGGSTYPTVYFTGVTGAAAASFDAGSLASGASSAGSPFTRNTLGQAQAANLVIAYVATDAGGTLTYTNTGYTVNQEQDGNNFWTGAIGYRAVNQTAAVASSFAVSPGASNGGTISYALKEATGGGGLSIIGAGGVAGGEAMGTPAASVQLSAAGAPGADAIGQPAAIAAVSSSSIRPGEAHGAPAIAATVAGQGIGGREAFGAPSTAAQVVGAGIAVVEAFGAPSVGAAPASIAVYGFDASGAAGRPSMAVAVGSSGVASGEALGSPATAVQVIAAGAQSAQAFGSPTVGGAAASLTATGIDSAAELGRPAVSGSVAAAGVGSAQALGVPSISASLQLAGAQSAETVRSPAFAVFLQRLVGLASTEAIGRASVGDGPPAEIACVGVSSTNKLGMPLVGAPFAPAPEIYRVPPENRMLLVRAENRMHRVPPENRILRVKP